MQSQHETNHNKRTKQTRPIIFKTQYTPTRKRPNKALESYRIPPPPISTAFPNQPKTCFKTGKSLANHLIRASTSLKRCPQHHQPDRRTRDATNQPPLDTTNQPDQPSPLSQNPYTTRTLAGALLLITTKPPKKQTHHSTPQLTPTPPGP